MISPEQQWDRTVALWMNDLSQDHMWIPWLSANEEMPPAPPYAAGQFLYGYRTWLLGHIVRPHKLFKVGDVCIVDPSNGAAERQPVCCFSSKGYSVRRHYMRYQTFWDTYETVFKRPGRVLGPRKSYRWMANNVEPIAKPNGCWMSVRTGQYNYGQAGPLRILFEIPHDLVGRRPDDAAVREYVLGTLRAGDAAHG